jgi:hypothetical protein
MILCSYFVIPTLADFPTYHWNAVCVKAILLLHVELRLHYSEPGRAKYLTNKKQGQGEKQILIGQLVSGKWKLETASVYTTLLKKPWKKHSIKSYFRVCMEKLPTSIKLTLCGAPFPSVDVKLFYFCNSVAVFVRKGKVVNVQCGSHKDFKGPLKTPVNFCLDLKVQ